MRLATLLALAALAAMPAIALAGLEDEEPAFIDLGKPLTHYATIARNDGSFRRLWIDESSLAAAEAGRPLPQGTIIAMETFYGPAGRSTIFAKVKQADGWLYGSFEPGKPDWQGLKSRTVCHSCHIDAAEDLTFTLPVIARFKADRRIARFLCDESGRVPCDAAVYDRQGMP